MREVTVKVYTFAELSDKAKAKALDKFRDVNVDHDWSEFIIDDWKDRLKERFGIYYKPEIHYSGFWSQGDGASFTGVIDEAWLLAFVRAHADSYPLLAAHLGDENDERKAEIYEATVERHLCGGHYVHENTCHVVLDVRCFPNEFTEDETKGIDDEVKRLADDLDEIRYDLCREIYRDLEQGYEYLTSDEAIRETIEENEYEFDEAGNVWL